MTPEALIYTPEPATAGVLQQTFRQFRIKTQIADRPGSILDLLRKHKFDAIAVDCRDETESIGIFEMTRRSESNRSAIMFAIAPKNVDKKSAWGANFQLESSTNLGRELSNCLRSAQSMILREHRRYRRIPVCMPVRLLGDYGEVIVESLNLSEGGICLNGQVRDSKSSTVNFHLHGTDMTIEAIAPIVWKNATRMGLRFDNITPRPKSTLLSWLDRQLPR